MQSTDSEGRAKAARGGHAALLQVSAAAVASIGTGKACAPPAIGKTPSSTRAATMLRLVTEFSTV
jgi:hypothetical protein